MTATAEKLLEIFDPWRDAFGSSKPSGYNEQKNKAEAESFTKKERLTVAVIDAHLESEDNAVGFFPLRPDGKCKFAVLDFDIYAEADAMHRRIVSCGAPFICFRTKSGGLHVVAIVPEAIDVLDMLAHLESWRDYLGLPKKIEIFPKQKKFVKNSFGNWINFPFAGVRSGCVNRALLDDKGKPITDESAAIAHIEARITKLCPPPLSDGPPCLQRVTRDGQASGGRNNVLFNAAVYAYKKHGEDFEDAVDEFNQRHFDTALKSSEVTRIVKGIEAKNYHFNCDDQPCASMCDQAVCLTRRFGVANIKTDDDDGESVLLPSAYLPAKDSAAKLYPRLDVADLCFLKGDHVVELVDGVIKRVSSQQFRTVIEKLGQTKIIRAVNQNDTNPRAVKCTVSNDIASELLACDAKRDHLRPLSVVTRVPLFNPDGSIMSPGWNPGGVYVTGSAVVPVIEYNEAVKLLLDLFDDFEFTSPADRARNFAMMITAAMRLCGLITAPCPIDFSEADHSQAGKTLRHGAIRAILGAEMTPIIPRKSAGTGSWDETLGEHLYKGWTFAPLDNLRGKLDSELIESLATSPSGFITVRLPNIGSVEIDVSRSTLQISSNGVTMTPDLANRCCVVRIKKRSEDVSFKYDDLLGEIVANRMTYLGAVLAVIRDWMEHDKPMAEKAKHDMRIWNRTLTWITDRAGLPDMNLHHAEIKTRMQSPTKGWLRSVSKHMVPDQDYSVSELIELSDAHEIDSPVVAGEKSGMYLGRKLSPLFTDEMPYTIIDDIKIERTVKEYKKKSGGTGTVKLYSRVGDTKLGDPECPY